MKESPTLSLRGKIIVVTGGSGRLGAPLCSYLLEKEARVICLDRTQPKLSFDNSNHLFIKADVTSKESLRVACEKALQKFESIHGLVNLAALDSRPNASVDENGPFENYPESSWDEVMRVNLKGTFLCCQVFGSIMARSAGGSIINVGSIYGVRSPDQSIYQYRRDEGEEFYKPVAYSASKSGLYNFTRYLAHYWGPRNVRTNILTLGGIFENQDKRFLDRYCHRVPLRRMANPEDYFGPIHFLLSDGSMYVNGANLVVDGGWTTI